MKELLFAIFMYPFILIGDISSFLHRAFVNIKYSFNKRKFNYKDIIEIEFFWNEIIDLGTSIFYEESNMKPINEHATIIPLSKDRFNKLQDVLIENKVLKYKRYIFKFSFTPFSDLFCTDAGEGEESLKIKFKDGQVFESTSYCVSKRFDSVVRYLREIEETFNK